MARQYVITEEEMLSLIETLELAKLRQFDSHASMSPIHRDEIESVHRTFHFHVVKWAQKMGFDGYRK